jgi:hypothetical protein
MKQFWTTIHVPIYEAIVQIVIADDIVSIRSSSDMVQRYGKPPLPDYEASIAYNHTGFFTLFLTPKVTIPILSHEIFHLTQRIWEWRYGTFIGNEQTADLCGYLTERITSEIHYFLGGENMSPSVPTDGRVNEVPEKRTPQQVLKEIITLLEPLPEYTQLSIARAIAAYYRAD